jgi:hypothetical protein
MESVPVDDVDSISCNDELDQTSGTLDAERLARILMRIAARKHS